MSVTATRASHVKTDSRDAAGRRMPLNEIDEPGAYVCHWTGYLLRMPPDAISSSGEPTFQLMAPEPLKVTRISDDPFISLTKARLIAADMDLRANF